MNIESARAIRAKASQEWDERIASLDSRNWRPTPTRAENDAKAASGDIAMVKEWDQSPIDPRAIDPVFDALPAPPPVVPQIHGALEVGSTLCALPGDVSRRRSFQWLRDEAPIPGATGLRYTLVDADAGAKISFRAITRAWQSTSRQVGVVQRPASWPS